MSCTGGMEIQCSSTIKDHKTITSRSQRPDITWQPFNWGEEVHCSQSVAGLGMGCWIIVGHQQTMRGPLKQRSYPLLKVTFSLFPL